jgi:DHA2 family multidrug resistance protein-like MFS transporter
LSLIRNMFLVPRERTLAVGVWTASYSVGGAVGPLLGGLILQHFHWGAVFLLAIPVMVLLLLAGPSLLPESRAPTGKRLDLGSAVLSLAAVLLVIYGLKVAAQEGPRWSAQLSAGAGIILGALFVRRQRQLADPLVDLRLFRSLAFRASLAIYLLVTLVTFGAYVLVGQYFQLVFGLSPLAAGLWMLPWSASYLVGSFLSPLLARRVQAAYVMAGGLLLATLGFLAATRAVALGPGALVLASTAYSLGLSPVFTLGIDTIIAAAPAERAGAAAALSETCSELGGALGIALLGSLATMIYRGSLGHAELPGLPAETRTAALDTLAAATNVAGQVRPERTGQILLEAARGAFAHAVRTTLILCAVLSALMAVLVMVRLRRVAVTGAAPGA